MILEFYNPDGVSICLRASFVVGIVGTQSGYCQIITADQTKTSVRGSYDSLKKKWLDGLVAEAQLGIPIHRIDPQQSGVGPDLRVPR